MSETKTVRSGFITCARCGSRVQTGVKTWGVFCTNDECRESEFYYE